jgi:transposase-like protein
MRGVNPESWKRDLCSVQVQNKKIITDRAVKHGSLCLNNLIERAKEVLENFVEGANTVILFTSN